MMGDGTSTGATQKGLGVECTIVHSPNTKIFLFLWRFRGPRDPERDSDVGHISGPRAPHSGSTLHLQPQTRGGGHGNMNQEQKIDEQNRKLDLILTKF